jgi:dihydroorotate dehydrogenase
MYKILRSILFLFDPEKIHYFTASSLHFILKIPFIRWFWKKRYVLEDPNLETTVFGLRFKNPVGLAAGFDKNASMYNDLAACGFGFIEIGTVTPKAQPGNDKPRLFRLKKDKAIINRMGFNNGGLETAVKNLKKRNVNCIIGGNIGKNKGKIASEESRKKMSEYRRGRKFTEEHKRNLSLSIKKYWNSILLRDL